MVPDGVEAPGVRVGAHEGSQKEGAQERREQLEASVGVLVFLTFLSFWATVYHDIFWILHHAFKVGALSYFIYWVWSFIKVHQDEETQPALCEECSTHVTTSISTSTQDEPDQPGDGLIFLNKDRSRRGTFKFSRKSSMLLTGGLDPDEGSMSRSGRGVSFRLIRDGDGLRRKRDEGSFRIVQKKDGAELVREDMPDLGKSRRRRKTVTYADQVENAIKEEDENEAGKDATDGQQTKPKFGLGSFRFRGKAGPSILRKSKKVKEGTTDVPEPSLLLPEGDGTSFPAKESPAGVQGEKSGASTRRERFKSHGSIKGDMPDGQPMMKRGQGSGSFMLVPVTPGEPPPKQAPGSFVLRPDGGVPLGESPETLQQTGDMSGDVVDGGGIRDIPGDVVDGGGIRSRKESTVSNRSQSLILKSRRESNQELRRRHSIGIQTSEQDRKQSVHQHVHYQVYQYYGKLVNISGEGPVMVGEGNQLTIGAPPGDEESSEGSSSSRDTSSNDSSSEEGDEDEDEDSFDFEDSDENHECDSVDGDFPSDFEDKVTTQHQPDLTSEATPAKVVKLPDFNDEQRPTPALPRRSQSSRSAEGGVRRLIKKSNSTAADCADVAAPFRNKGKKKKTVQQVLAGLFSGKKKNTIA